MSHGQVDSPRCLDKSFWSTKRFRSQGFYQSTSIALPSILEHGYLTATQCNNRARHSLSYVPALLSLQLSLARPPKFHWSSRKNRLAGRCMSIHPVRFEVQMLTCPLIPGAVVLLLLKRAHRSGQQKMDMPVTVSFNSKELNSRFQSSLQGFG